jgi:hypothetical protein
VADSDLTPPEEELRKAMTTGGRVDLRKHDPQADDPSQGAQWGAERTIRAEVLADLLTQVTGSQRPRAVRLAGARVTGKLDLEAAELLCPVMLVPHQATYALFTVSRRRKLSAWRFRQAI